MTNDQFNPYGEEFNKVQDILGHQSAGLVGFLIKVSGGRIKTGTANNILVIVMVVSFTLSTIIFSGMFFSQKNNEKSKPAPISKEMVIPIIKQEFPGITDTMIERLPETFYREDIPSDVAGKLTPEIINSVPPRP